jgi:mannose-6-phosphate isomerase-like protein (cupin superfamily)
MAPGQICVWAQQSSHCHPTRRARQLTGMKWYVQSNLLSKNCPLTLVQHDETFLVTQGTVRFHAKNGKHIDAKAGDYVTVPTRSPHTFSNPFDEEAKFFNTFTPAHYINYFKLLHTMSQEGVPMNPEANKKAMAYFATIGVDGPL